ncbi:hypothetical protein HDU84_007791 [Entophlyctis sp. JEL0112]|nr:hypothetical protein HDU84_007791 [Entophlyctis sp. JEL0112]
MSAAMSLLEALNLQRLADHWRIVVVSALVWQGIYLATRTRSASFVNAIVVCALAVPMFYDPALYQDKLWGYSKYGGDVNAVVLGTPIFFKVYRQTIVSSGYFLWDIYISLQLGDIGFIIHGVAACTVFLLCYKPFVMYYGAVFIMWELSTPFLNVHWMCDKLGMTGGTLQLVNGVLLLIVFFGSRLVFGMYKSFEFLSEFPLPSRKDLSEWCFSPSALMRARYEEIPVYMIVLYLAMNTVLNTLNVYWFWKMIDSVRRRFSAGGDAPGKAKKSE